MTKKLKIKKPKSMILRGVGKTPAIDWLIIGAIFVCLVIVAITSSAFRFSGIKQTLLEDNVSPGGAVPVLTKTQKEEADDILQIYRKKKERHLELLSKIKADTVVEKKNAQVVATTTATSTVPAATGTSR